MSHSGQGWGWGGTEGASDPALGIREGFLQEGASALGLGAVCCGKRGWGVPERGSSMCEPRGVGDRGTFRQTQEAFSC